MKTKFHLFRFILITSLFLVTLSSSCRRDRFGVDGSGSTITQTRMLNSFNGVDLSIDANVVMHVDSVYRVELHGQQNVLNVLTTTIHGNTLKVSFSRNVHSHTDLTVHVYAPRYVYAGISGSGNIESVNGWTCADFEAKISGSGNISVTGIQTGAVHSTISGSGAITLGGNCTSLTSSISGSGDLHAFGLAGNTGDVNVSGSGKSELNLTQSIDVHISGAGDVYYKNTPAINVNISGAGNLIHVQ